MNIIDCLKTNGVADLYYYRAGKKYKLKGYFITQYTVGRLDENRIEFSIDLQIEKLEDVIMDGLTTGWADRIVLVQDFKKRFDFVDVDYTYFPQFPTLMNEDTPILAQPSFVNIKGTGVLKFDLS